ncbi:MAG: hypothetical protein AAFP10_07240 [Pseudomonadota bacterium]
MLETHDGREIILDVDRIKSNAVSYSGFLNISWLMPLIFLFSPAVMLSANKLGGPSGWLLFYLSLFFCIALVIFGRLNFNHIKSPLFAYYISLGSFSPRVFFPSAMLWYANANHPLILELFIFGLWVLIEYLAYRKCHVVSNHHIIKAFKANFRLSDTGDILYDSTRPRNEKWANSHQDNGSFLYYFENFGGYFLVIFGPIIFIFSQLQRTDFEPRFMIAMIMCLILGLGSRFMLTDYYFVKRIIKLRQKQKF